MWQRRKILVLGMTYPSYSKKYVENVCTGGLFEDTLEMCRIHPVPKRYWDSAEQFKSWQWIETEVRRDTDPRPESFRIGERVELGSVMESGSKGWAERRPYLEKSPYLFEEWGALQEAHASRKISLAIVRPAEIVNIKLEQKTESEREEWIQKEKDLLAQQDMLRDIKPLNFVPVRFKVAFRCKDEDRPHEMSLLQWGIHELYRRYKNSPWGDMEEKLLAKLRQGLDLSKRDVFLFVGTFRARLDQWGLMDCASPPKKPLEQPKKPAGESGKTDDYQLKLL